VDLAALGARLALGAFGGTRSRCSRQQRHASWGFYHLGDEGTYGLRTSGHGATDGAVRTHEHDAGAASYPVGFGNLPVLLQQHVCESVLLCLGPVLLAVPSADQGYGHLVLVSLLPAAYLRQQGVAGTAGRVGEKKYHRLARREYRVKGKSLPVEAVEAEVRGQRADWKAHNRRRVLGAVW
jgi:hypothetical protein